MLADDDMGADADVFSDAGGVSNDGRGVDAGWRRRPVIEQVCQPGIGQVWVSGDQAIDRAVLCVFFPAGSRRRPGLSAAAFCSPVGQESDLRRSGFFQRGNAVNQLLSIATSCSSKRAARSDRLCLLRDSGMPVTGEIRGSEFRLVGREFDFQLFENQAGDVQVRIGIDHRAGNDKVETVALRNFLHGIR